MFRVGQEVTVLVRENLSTEMTPCAATILEANVLSPKGGVDHSWHKVLLYKGKYTFNAHERYVFPILDYNDVMKDIL